MTLRLFGTPKSHFTRIVRIVGHELDLPFEVVDIGNVGAAETFGGNPLMQVPALADGPRSIWGTSNICRYLVGLADVDPLHVCTQDWSAVNLAYVIQGVMSAEVQLILAERSGLEAKGPRFDKIRSTIERGLAFVDGEIEVTAQFSYVHACAISMWDHLLLYENAMPSDSDALNAVARGFGERPSVVATRPPR